mmetsp:Transcript_94464/g.206768  ORF Transcript_94464/g.206768 Transcript_94464/m.206768 type:complete len:84 (-) Transcript_94464:81-332(-)
MSVPSKPKASKMTVTRRDHRRSENVLCFAAIIIDVIHKGNKVTAAVGRSMQQKAPQPSQVLIGDPATKWINTIDITTASKLFE